MPTYRYICPNGHELLHWHSIHDDDRPAQVPCEECDRMAVFAFSKDAYISVMALPNKGANARKIVAREAGWNEDMPAYYRMRTEGLQPPSIDGAAELERKATHPIEVEMGKTLTGTEADKRATIEAASEMTGSDVEARVKEAKAARKAVS